ncbi:hypothetical protein B1R32_13410 [Abditibacterium utsteinense]|uniref:Uncharacterized protein n=1 Tax=Abditibacterium utsteinense TaxID=1960156 RepID=A0A2S8SNT0_9BACT|nr:hypothetical protein [Abditibacterium utsteinense]PQV62452.1 hypothetical protein B1R32_13410 [Abditibacterium utsteinense]
MARQKILFNIFLFTLGFAVATLWQGFKSRVYFRPVQRLASPDRAHLAVLERVDNIDFNFRILLDGQKIYHSPDFNPNSSLPFRETLLWDTTGKLLIFQVTRRQLFGYDVLQQRVLSGAEVLQAKVATPTEMEISFEGKWPGAK